MLQRIRETLTLALIVLLPFHALLVTAGTKFLIGPYHAPMPMLAVWKEELLGIIILIIFLETLTRWSRETHAIAKTDPVRAGISVAYPLEMAMRKFFRRCDIIDWIILILVFISGLLLLSTDSPNIGLYALGFKYDFIPLVAFLIFRRVPWSEWFTYKAQTLLIGVGVILSLYGILTLFLPVSFFTWLGYSDAHSLYIPGGPLAAFQQIGGEGIRRVQSTMSGPNQLGIWLLIPWSIGVVHLVRRQNALLEIVAACTAVIGIAILLTFSRSAWIAATLIALIAIGRNFDKKFIAGAGAAVIVGLIAIAAVWPAVFVRIASSRDHYLRPLAAIQSIIAHPLGQGLGSAGPASNRVSDACVYLDAGADVSWAKDRADLCVFVDNKQVQPAAPCRCPFLPENWYLQIGVELGVLGLILYVTLIGFILKNLWQVASGKWPVAMPQATSYQLPAFLMFLGISIAALFLHAWEDVAVAYTGWVLVAGVMYSKKKT